MSTTLIGVPPGVGDVYWCLAKLKAFKAHYGLGHVTLAIQKTSKDRSIEWRTMVDFVDDARYVALTPGNAATADSGLSRNHGPLDFVMWPNAIVDRGRHLSTWLPELELDLDFPVKTTPMNESLENRIVLYPSAAGVNRAWFPKRRSDFWIALAVELANRFGVPPLVIGADWDHDNSDPLAEVAQSLVGHTTLGQVAWILEHARAVVGVISGMTILANHFKRPTLAFAPDKHHPDFPYTWVRNQPWYRCLRPVSMFDPSAAVEALAWAIDAKESHITFRGVPIVFDPVTP
ncbi:MAG TPA: hypothetical protein VE907_06250 [Gammaproteobacteria bacterium]|nr:hypothetical protein [Gammaproteobacteria bacterium]